MQIIRIMQFIKNLSGLSQRWIVSIIVDEIRLKERGSGIRRGEGEREREFDREKEENRERALARVCA